MKLLAGTHYDPAVAVSASTASLLAMTAFDTTNLRLTFTAPSTGNVLVRLRCTQTGATTSPSILLGVLDGATVRGRAVPICAHPGNAAAGAYLGYTTSFLVTGLTPGTSYTWDAAYGVEFVVASTNIKYGGPNDTVATNAFGAFAFEIWDAEGLLAGTHYDPGTADTSKSVASLLAMTALDTTNLRLSFVCPSSGKVLVRLKGAVGNGTTFNQGILWGILDGATVKKRARGVGSVNADDASAAATQFWAYEAVLLVTGLTPGTTYNWDAAYGVELAQTAGTLAWGGPDNTTQNDAWGGFAYEIWNPDALPRAIGQAA